MMAMDDIVKSITATDEFTVVFQLNVPNAAFINNLGMHFASILSPTAAIKYGVDFQNTPVGTGPFVFDKWIRGDRLILKANENYYNGRPYLDRVIFRVIPENAVRFLELKTGNIHMIQCVCSITIIINIK